MGTRADLYTLEPGGRKEDPNALNWFGSIAWDGYDLNGPQFASTHQEWVQDLEKLKGERDDFTSPSDGWPWPWDDSRTTDYAYVFEPRFADTLKTFPLDRPITQEVAEAYDEEQRIERWWKDGVYVGPTEASSFIKEYACFGVGMVYASIFGGPWHPACFPAFFEDDIGDEETAEIEKLQAEGKSYTIVRSGKATEFPNMKHRKNVQFGGTKSGILLIGPSGLQETSDFEMDPAGTLYRLLVGDRPTDEGQLDHAIEAVRSVDRFQELWPWDNTKEAYDWLYQRSVTHRIRLLFLAKLCEAEAARLEEGCDALGG